MELQSFKSELGFKHKLRRLIWGVFWGLFFRTSPRVCHAWRCFLLRLFGAKIGRGVRIYNSAKVYYPPNLSLDDFVVVGPDVDLYCVAPIKISANSMVSQYSYLCAASHDYRQSDLPLIALPINIGSESWVLRTSIRRTWCQYWQSSRGCRMCRSRKGYSRQYGRRRQPSQEN